MFSLIPWRKRQTNLASQDTRAASPFNALQDAFDSFLGRITGLEPWDERSPLGSWSDVMPAECHAGLEDNEDAYLFRVEMPGFEPEDFDVKVSGNSLTVRAEHKEDASSDEGSGYRYGKLSRTFSLPHGVNADNITARYHSGMLEVRLPKTEAAMARRIDVKSV